MSSPSLAYTIIPAPYEAYGHSLSGLCLQPQALSPSSRMQIFQISGATLQSI